MTAKGVARPVSYTNRRGQVYYLHAGKTKIGKRRYFVAKTIGAGVLAELPAGFEIVESVNAVVSVRRIDPSVRKVPETDLARVRAELAKHPRLRRYRADVVKGEIIVFEPIGGLSDDLARHPGGVVPDGSVPARGASVRARQGHALLARPALRSDRGTVRGVSDGPLGSLVPKYLKKLGTSAFFELY